MENLTKDEIKRSYSLFVFQKKAKIKKIFQTSGKTFTYTYLFIFVLLAVYPFFWNVMQSFNNSDLISTSGTNPIPKSGMWTLDNYRNLFNSPSTKKYIYVWLFNSLFYAFASATLNTILNFLAGYALARISFKGKRNLTFYFLASIVIPTQATMLPTYAIYQTLGIFNRNMPIQLWFFAILFKGMANIVLALQIRQFYLSQKADIEEASRLEGLSRFKSFFLISIRQMLPLFAIQFTLVFLGGWNDFITFRLFSLGSLDKYNLTTGILNLASSNTSSNGLGVALALSTITFIPMFIIYGITLKIQSREMSGGYK